LHAAEEGLTLGISSQLGSETAGRVDALIAVDTDDEVGEEGDEQPVLGKIKEDPGNLSLETMLTEIDKLLAVRAIGLPSELFAGVAPRVVGTCQGF